MQTIKLCTLDVSSEWPARGSHKCHTEVPGSGRPFIPDHAMRCPGLYEATILSSPSSAVAIEDPFGEDPNRHGLLENMKRMVSLALGVSLLIPHFQLCHPASAVPHAVPLRWPPSRLCPAVTHDPLRSSSRVTRTSGKEIVYGSFKLFNFDMPRYQLGYHLKGFAHHYQKGTSYRPETRVRSQAAALEAIENTRTQGAWTDEDIATVGIL